MPKLFTRAEAEEFFARLKKLDPEPKTELQYVNPYTLLVAVVMSAQATDKGVNKATAPLFKTVKMPEQMVALGEEKLAEAIKTIGLYRGKAKNVVALSRILLEQHGGKVPADREALQALPGVGRKTATVVLNVALVEPTIAVDAHIFHATHRPNLPSLDGADRTLIPGYLEQHSPPRPARAGGWRNPFSRSAQRQSPRYIPFRNATTRSPAPTS